MLLESDLLIAYLKKQDWLKPFAKRIIDSIDEGKLEDIQVSTEVFHELYYVFSDYAPLHVILTDEAKITAIRNLTFLDPTPKIYLSALNLMEVYAINSIFDAIYAATTLSSSVPDHTILTTDEAYGRIRGIKRLDPREVKL